MLIKTFSNLGVTLNDIQKINFSDFSPEFCTQLGSLKLESYNQIRGKTFISKIGYLLKLNAENLVQKLESQRKQMMLDLDELLGTAGCQIFMKDASLVIPASANEKRASPNPMDT